MRGFRSEIQQYLCGVPTSFQLYTYGILHHSMGRHDRLMS